MNVTPLHATSTTAAVWVEVVSCSLITRLGVETLLRDVDDLEVVDARGAHRVPDVVLLELVDPDPTELEALHHLSRRTPVVALTHSTEDGARALSGGAHTRLSMNTTGSQLAEVLTDAATTGRRQPHRSFAHPSSASPPARASAPHSERWAGSSLSLREHTVLELLAAGLDAGAAARSLSISIASAKLHLRGAYRKTGVRTRAQAALWATGSIRGAVPAEARRASVLHLPRA